MKFTVARKEIYTQYLDVEAESYREAMDLVCDDAGDLVGEPEFYDNLDRETWSVCDSNGASFYGDEVLNGNADKAKEA